MSTRTAGTADHQLVRQLIRPAGPSGDRRPQIELRDTGVEGFVFTFG
jgi:hypothetical protein